MGIVDDNYSLNGKLILSKSIFFSFKSIRMEELHWSVVSQTFDFVAGSINVADSNKESEHLFHCN